MKHYSKEFKEEALKLSDEIGVKRAAQLNQVVTDLLEGAAADMGEMPEEK